MKLKLIDEDWLDKMISKCENTLSLTTEALAGNTSKFLLLKHIKEEQLKSPKEEIEKAFEAGGNCGTGCVNEFIGFDNNLFEKLKSTYLKKNNYE